VEIITAANASPNAAWINFVVTGKARSHVRNYLRVTHAEEAATLGERLFNKALLTLNPSAAPPDLALWERLIKENGAHNKQELFSAMGLGRKLPLVVAHQLLHMQGEKTGAPAHPHAIVIRGTEGIAVELALCCHPIPGDPILGFIHKDRGLIIHSHDCPAIGAFRADPDKWLDVEWEAEPGQMFDVAIKVIVGNRRGVLAKVAAAISEQGSNIDNVAMEEEDGSPYTVLYFTLQVENRMHLARVMRGLRGLEDVVRIFRVKGKKDGRALSQ
jgi:GTP pyrophosphokinase